MKYISLLIYLITVTISFARKIKANKGLELLSQEECQKNEEENPNNLKMKKCIYKDISEGILPCENKNYCQIIIDKKQFCWRNKKDDDCKSYLTKIDLNHKSLETIFNQFENELARNTEKIPNYKNMLENTKTFELTSDQIRKINSIIKDNCYLIFDGYGYVKFEGDNSLIKIAEKINKKIDDVTSEYFSKINVNLRRLNAGNDVQILENILRFSNRIIQEQIKLKNFIKFWPKKTDSCSTDIYLHFHKEVAEKIILMKNCIESRNKYECKDEENKSIVYQGLCNFQYGDNKFYFQPFTGEECNKYSLDPYHALIDIKKRKEYKKNKIIKSELKSQITRGKTIRD
jgi:hypothetical protein